MSAQTVIQVDHLGIHHENTRITESVNFHLNRGQFACLLGPSGCGKTTILRAIAGFIKPSAGTIKVNDQIVSGQGVFLPPEQRKIGMVFQDYALFPHLNVAKNVGFGIKAGASHPRVQELLSLIGLSHLAKRYPHELSGGQQQRIALARALASKPDVILLDEPFSNLDIDLREKLGLQIKDIFEQTDTTAIFVTHSHQEAFALADQIGVLQEGKLLQWDTPYNIYHEPATPFIAQFIGQGIFLPATLIAPDTFETPLGILKGDRAYSWPPGSNVRLLIRPDDIVFDQTSGKTAPIVKRIFQGPDIIYHIQVGENLVLPSIVPSHHELQVGDHFPYQIDAMHLVAFLEK